MTAQAHEEAERRTGPVVVTGDFNVAKDSDLVPGFAARSGLEDAFAGQAPATFRTGPGRASRCIDHLLYRPGRDRLAVAESALAFTAEQSWPGQPPAYLSDHLGLLVRLEARPAC